VTTPVAEPSTEELPQREKPPPWQCSKTRTTSRARERPGGCRSCRDAKASVVRLTSRCLLKHLVQSAQQTDQEKLRNMAQNQRPRTAWSHNEGCRLQRGVAHPISVRYDFPRRPVGLDGYERSIGVVEGSLEDRRKDFYESVVQTSDIKVPLSSLIFL
jgi:hypothetical protein